MIQHFSYKPAIRYPAPFGPVKRAFQGLYAIDSGGPRGGHKPGRAPLAGWFRPACSWPGRVLVAMLASTWSVFREGGELPKQAGHEDASRRLIQPG